MKLNIAKVYDLMSQKGIRSQKELGALTGKSAASISAILNRQSSTMETVSILAAALGVNVSDIAIIEEPARRKRKVEE